MLSTTPKVTESIEVVLIKQRNSLSDPYTGSNVRISSNESINDPCQFK